MFNHLYHGEIDHHATQNNNDNNDTKNRNRQTCNDV